MFRTFGVQTLTGNAQNLLQDKLTADFVISIATVDPVMTVADTTKYQVGDRITLDPGQSDADTVLVGTILGPTTMKVSSQGAMLHAHANNTIIALDLCSGIILVTAIIGNSGTVWLGADNTLTNIGGGSAFLPITAGGSYNLGQGQWNVVRSTDAWMAGTLNDKVAVAAYVV